MGKLNPGATIAGFLGDLFDGQAVPQPKRPNTGRLMKLKQREARAAEAIGQSLFERLLLDYAELKLLGRDEEARDMGLKLLPYIKPRRRSIDARLDAELRTLIVFGGEEEEDDGDGHEAGT